MLDKEVVAATLGAKVQTAELSAVKDQGGFDLYSQCSYALADGRMLVFGTGQATNDVTVPEQVKSMRDQGAIIATKPIVDLPGVGKAALWRAEPGRFTPFWVTVGIFPPRCRSPIFASPSKTRKRPERRHRHLAQARCLTRQAPHRRERKHDDRAHTGFSHANH